MSKSETGRRPSVCRAVLYRTSHADEQWNGKSEHAAIITGVVSNDVVDLIVFPVGGMPLPRVNVVRAGAEDTPMGFARSSWAWPVIS
jgi:hypothetical protein